MGLPGRDVLLHRQDVQNIEVARDGEWKIKWWKRKRCRPRFENSVMMSVVRVMNRMRTARTTA